VSAPTFTLPKVKTLITSDFLWDENPMGNNGVNRLRIDLEYYSTIQDGIVYEGGYYVHSCNQPG